MTNIIRTTTEFAMHIASAYISPGDIIIDATCGNGNDTLKLARSNPAKLYAFDIQQSALDSTRALLKSEGFTTALDSGDISLICDSHSNMQKYVTGYVKLIVFNLGYLPGADKSVTTVASSTLDALQSSLHLLTKDGLICITMYSGHTQGAEEKNVLLEFAENLDSKYWHVSYISMLNQRKNPPEILLITKKL